MSPFTGWGAVAIDREARCDERSQPRLVRPLFRRRLVDVEDRLRRQLFAQSVATGAQRVGHDVLQLDRQPRTARLPFCHNQVQRQAPPVAEIRRREQTTFPTQQSPTRERLPSFCKGAFPAK